MSTSILRQFSDDLVRLLDNEERKDNLNRELRSHLEKVEKAVFEVDKLLQKFKHNSGFSKKDLEEIYKTWQRVAANLPISEVRLNYGPNAPAFYGDWSFCSPEELMNIIEKWTGDGVYDGTLATKHHELSIRF